VVNHSLRYAGTQGNFFGAGAVNAVAGKFFFGGRQNSRAC
jgi:hypothetical protein